jgi:hypothetical protein
MEMLEELSNASPAGPIEDSVFLVLVRKVAPWVRRSLDLFIEPIIGEDRG